MRLIDLEPKWLLRNGVRVGFVFQNPVRPKWWVSCFVVAMPTDEQEDLIEAVLKPDAIFQPCNPGARWSVLYGIEAANFETISVTPSLDGGPNLWHGHITDGQIVGGI